MKVNFERLHWENYPSLETPVNADNLNRLEEGVAGLYSDLAEIEEELGDGVGEYVTGWLDDHVTPTGSAVIVDDTLTIQGAAADAKKTGDEISDLKDELNVILGVGKNLYNPNSELQEGGVYVSNANGVIIAGGSYKTAIVPIDATKGSISVNTTYTFINFLSEVEDINDYNVGNIIESFISGELAQATPLAGVTIPNSAKAVCISTATTKFATLQVEYGDTITAYEEYESGIKGNKILSHTIPRTALAFDLPNVQIFDNSLYALPYIADGKLMCNKATDAGTGYYTGVDSKGTPEVMTARFIWENAKANSGTVALISQKNGLNSVSAITTKSFHLILTRTHVALNLLDSGTSSEDVISAALATPMLADGETEHTVSVSISGNTVTITVDDETFTGTAQNNLSDYIGRYVQIEHYASGNMDSYTMPMFTYWKVTGANIWTTIEDNFSRPNGLLTRTPQGYEYHVFTNINNGY